MAADGAMHASAPKVTPKAGEGTLGTWRFWTGLGHRAEEHRVLQGERASSQTTAVWGVLGVSRSVSDPVGRRRWESQGQNRTREIRPSGIVGGLAETWLWEPA
jgi:hypothetical protein